MSFNNASQIKIINGRWMWDNGVNLIETGTGTLRLWKSGESGGTSECEYAELTHLNVNHDFTDEFLENFAKIFCLHNGNPFSGIYDKNTNTRMPQPITDEFTKKVVGYSWHYWPSTN